jgi:prolyl oligopeptidase
MKIFIRFYVLFFLVSILDGCGEGITEMDYPKTKKLNLVENIFGQTIEDPYRWLEDFTSTESREWVEKQNIFSDKFLSNPYQKQIKKELEDIWVSDQISVPYKKGNKTFYFFNDGKKQQSIFMVRGCDDCEAKVLLDPNNFSKDGTISLGDVSVSPDGKKIAYSISDGGSDWRTWKVMDIETKEDLVDKIEWSKFSYATWESDSSGFYYQKYEKPDEALADVNRSPQLYFHRLSDSQKEDKLIYQDEQNPDRSWSISVPEEGSYRVLSIGEGTDERNLVYIQLDQGADFTPVIKEFEATYNFLGGLKNTLWFYTTLGAPRGKVVSLNITRDGQYSWHDVIGESHPISSVSITGMKIIVNYLKDTITDIKFFDLEGNYLSDLDFPNNGSINGFYGNIKDNTAYFEFTNYTSPEEVFEINLDTLSYEPYWKSDIPGFNADEYLSELRFYPSLDGTEIPIHIASKKGLKIDEDTPVLLYGYGGFNIPILPNFSKTFYMWIKSGGVLAVANLRGGSEYGDAWHEGGMLLNKQNVFDDFASAVKYLHQEEIGSSETTVSLGRSNGGLLVAATMLQNPNLFKVAIPQVGVLDMLRFHKFTIGWAWTSDYGEPDKEEDFINLLSYSPYHNIKKDVCYPTTLITTSSRDDRVVPAHSYKFAAKLQELQSCDNPILLRVESRAGHGAGTSKDKQIDEIADIFGYALSVIKGN